MEESKPLPRCEEDTDNQKNVAAYRKEETMNAKVPEPFPKNRGRFLGVAKARSEHRPKTLTWGEAVQCWQV